MENKIKDISRINKRRTLLIVDDVEVNRKIINKIFCETYDIYEAENGQQALDKMKLTNPSGIILDLKMPVMDGITFLQLKSQEEKYQKIPVIVITGETENKKQIEALDAGALDVITKPFNSGIMIHRVNNIIERAEAIEQNENYRLAEERLYFTTHDQLTGLNNRNTFVDEAKKMILSKPSNSYIISCLDIDGFKVINARFGHNEGDRLLKFIANTRKSELEGIDGILCRDTADHFIAILPNEKEIIDSITDHFLLAIKNYDLPMNIIVHIGRYTIDDISLDINQMIERALLAVKSIRKNTEKYIADFDYNMRNKALRNQEPIDTMRPALEKGEFIPYFQPQYDYVKKTICGAEVLVRWNNPEKGLVSPGEFIPLFEENGFICRLDEYIWDAACKQVREWLDKGIKVPHISVNISRRDIGTIDVVNIVSNIIKKYDLSPNMLHLEITESSYVDHLSYLIDVIHSLQEKGFIVEMDDFGSGYSSLNTLKDVPLDIVKLDMQFNCKVSIDTKSGNILSSVVRMINWLKLPIIAEGVETVEQADFLKSIGCHVMQGYHFYRPMPASDYEKILTSNQDRINENTLETKELKGVVNFLDASAQSTLLFNSFVGGAHIVEYDGNTLESLRANDRFYELIGITSDEYSLNGTNLFNTIYPESRDLLKERLELAISTGKEQQCVIHSYPNKKTKEEKWFLNRIRFLAQTELRSLFYITIEDNTPVVELEKVTQRLENIVKNVPAGIVICEKIGNLYKPVYLSDRAIQLFGYDKDDNIEEIFKIQYPNFEPYIQTVPMINRQKFYSENKPIEITFPGTKKDNHHFWCRGIFNYVVEKNKPLVYVTLSDVSEHYKSSEDFNFLINYIPGGLYKYCIEDGNKISYASDSLLRMLGYTHDEFYEKFSNNCWNLVYKADFHTIYNTVCKQIQQKGEYSPCEYRINAKESTKWVLEAGRIYVDYDGKNWVYAVVIDITEQKKLEDQLYQQAKQNEAMIANAPSGVITIAVDGDKQYCEFFSDGLCRMLGYNREELTFLYDKSISEIVNPLDRERVNEAAKESILGMKIFSEEYRLRRKDGRYIWINLTGNPVKEKDGIIRFYCLYNNIDEHKRNEELVRLENERNRLIIQYNSLGVFDYDFETDTLDVETSNRDEEYIKRRFTNYSVYIGEENKHTDEDVKMIRNLIMESKKHHIHGTINYPIDI